MKDRQLLLAVLAQLEREKEVSIPQLAALLGVSEDEIYDALETLVFAYDAASIRLDLHDAHAALETRGVNRLLRLTGPETDALVDALHKVGFTGDDELVCVLLQTKSMVGGEAGASPRMQVISETGMPDVTEVVAQACDDPKHHLLQIEYQGIDDAAAQQRAVEPVRIFSEDGHRYLQGYCRKAEGWRSFRIDRITKAEQLEQDFSPRTDVPAPSIGLAGNVAKARIELDPDCALPSWRNMRVSKARGSDKRIITVDWSGSSWLPKHVVALMGKARVLEPNSLKAACHAYAQESLKSIT